MTVTIRNISGGPDPEVFHFPGGEPHVKVEFGRVRGASFIIEVRGGTWDDLGAALVANDALRRLGAVYIDLFIPYLPGARQDRGAPLTAKVYADAINSAHFDEVVCVDPHSDVMPALVDKLRIVPLHAVFPLHILDEIPSVLGKPFLICPDAGAGKRVEALATHVYEERNSEIEVVYARKHRDFATGKLSGFSIGNMPNGVGIIVDDICDGGGTFIGLAEETHRRPEHLRLWTTHGIYSKGVNPMLKDHFSWVGCTDSLPTCGVADHVTPVRP